MTVTEREKKKKKETVTRNGHTLWYSFAVALAVAPGFTMRFLLNAGENVVGDIEVVFYFYGDC